jgi:peptidoglycan hydrolase-like protein with peptidoglycan-binding domain
VDGIYGSKTKAAVKAFQALFGLNPTGTVNQKTWYKISQLYVGVSGIAEYS